MKINKITEQTNSSTKNIDQKSIDKILISMNNEDQLVANQVKKSIPDISSFIDKVVQKLKKSGRLIYIGSGTSGRLGVLDASECPPTFGVPQELVVGLIAGGDRALKESIEGAEDSLEDSVQQLKEIDFNDKDILLGISASGSTPYVLKGLEYAHKIGASTGFLTCNHIQPLKTVDYLISITVGPEILSGSTRLKSGTATKMVLNMISTASMMKMNRTFGNIMIDLLPKNKKLIRRAINIIIDDLKISDKEAEKLYKLSDNNLKVAILMGRKNINFDEAREILSNNKGSLADSLKG
tara:strand:+ start:1607 stop:2494 length:888 start_codon:yes stop_codon:yes gene_type:complete